MTERLRMDAHEGKLISNEDKSINRSYSYPSYQKREERFTLPLACRAVHNPKAL